MKIRIGEDEYFNVELGYLVEIKVKEEKKFCLVMKDFDKIYLVNLKTMNRYAEIGKIDSKEVNKIFGFSNLGCNILYADRDLLWARGGKNWLLWNKKEPIQEMTMEEVCSALGKNIKIINKQS